MSTTSTKTLAGTLTDSSGQVATIPPQPISVITYDAPTASLTGVPTSAASGSTVTGKVVAKVDAALTVKSIGLTLDGAPVTVAADGSFSVVV